MNRFYTNKVLSLLFHSIISYKNLFINAFVFWKKRTYTLEKSALVQLEGKRKIVSTHKFYNLDVIISVDYRVKSNKGISFRKWANNVLKHYLLKGFVIDGDRVTVSKKSFLELENNVREIKNERCF